MQTIKNIFAPQSPSRVVETYDYENFRAFSYTPLTEKDEQLDERTAI